MDNWDLSDFMYEGRKLAILAFNFFFCINLIFSSLFHQKYNLGYGVMQENMKFLLWFEKISIYIEMR